MRKLIRQLWPLLMLGFLINTAYSVMWPLTTIYLHNQLRLNSEWAYLSGLFGL